MRGLKTDMPMLIKFTPGFRTVLAALTVAAIPAGAADLLQARDAWVRASAPGQTNAAVYMQLLSASDVKLVAVDCPVAAKAQLHETRVDGGVMKMRPIAGLALPAGKSVVLAPGGTHIMLTGLKHPLKAGERVPLILTAEGAGGPQRAPIEVTVRATDAAGPGHHH